MMHNLETIYRKLRSVAKIAPGEYAMLFRDFDKRIAELEGNRSNGTEKPSSTGRKSSKVSKKKVSTNRMDK